ncbi:MAG: epoxyqueuosine reductase QueH [Tannerella sp.]|jgi:predicted adenine nucleotide alpha hydrolase (AANH) superfamily ATPase|nr:epoxyqueuosine reductase QueH [Tannerella sp.]
MRLLLHSCCAPCSAAVIENLLAEGLRPTLFYFNPNIYPSEEYNLRKAECSHYARLLDLDFIDGDYDHAAWRGQMTGLEKEPERGRRCLACFKLRLAVTASVAAARGFDTIATTLSSSRWKDLKQINEAGACAVAPYEGMNFLARNWRKGGLSERRRILIRENLFYNQTYCGCEFSRRDP